MEGLTTIQEINLISNLIILILSFTTLGIFIYLAIILVTKEPYRGQDNLNLSIEQIYERVEFQQKMRGKMISLVFCFLLLISIINLINAAFK